MALLKIKDVTSLFPIIPSPPMGERVRVRGKEISGCVRI
jgi:hypothetical protein